MSFNTDETTLLFNDGRGIWEKVVSKKTLFLTIYLTVIGVCLIGLLASVVILFKRPEGTNIGPHGPTKPTPVGITNFVGIGYNIIGGNPEGGDIHLGGVDPGFLVTRPILKLTYNDGLVTSDLRYQVPDQVVFTPRSSCVKTAEQETVYGTESYINRISVDVSMSELNAKVLATEHVLNALLTIAKNCLNIHIFMSNLPPTILKVTRTNCELLSSRKEMIT